jgi:CRISPR system Cascade subunit CasB
MATVTEASYEVGRCVSQKIGKLQSGYLQGLSSSRATLARLRKLDTPGGGSWMVVGEEIFSQLPDFGLGRESDQKALKSIKAALKLYAIHQQSKNTPMAVFPQKGSGQLGSFGRACHLITLGNGDEGSVGVRRRMASVEAASDLTGAETCLRSLVRQMKAKDIPLDYGSLARDLFLIQFENAREGVFLRWARDYYAPKPTTQPTSNQE